MRGQERYKKVLFVIRSLNIGGAERQLIELAAGLARDGWHVTVATFYGGGLLEPLLAEHGVRHVALEKSGRWDVLPFLYRLLKLVRAEKPDIVYSWLTMSNVLTGILHPFVRPTRVVWGVATSNMDLSYYDWLARVESALEVRLARRADLIVCNSVAGRNCHVERGYPATRTVVVCNGIDTDKFRPDANAREQVRAQWGIMPGEALIGIIGRLDPIKDHPSFLAAARRVAAARPRTRFVCVGDGSRVYRTKLRSLADELGIAERISWVNERTDIWRVYNALDLLVSSSISEGLTNVIAEAMATDVRCVATAVGDSARLVDNPRWLAPAGDSAALADAIGNALDDPPSPAGAARARIVAEYGVRRLALETAEHFRSLLAPDAAGHATGGATPKIMFLTRKLDVGGAQRQLVELALGLHAAGWQVTVATFYGGGALAAPLRVAGIRTLDLEKKGRWHVATFASRLVRLMRRERPDIVHSYLETSNVLLTLLRPFAGRMRVVWGVRASNMDLTKYDRLAAVESRVARGLARHADLIICNSEAGRSYHLGQGYPADRMVVVPNGVDIRRFAPDESARRALRAEWGIGAEDVLIGMAARLDPMKDHRNFLAAAARIAAERKRVRFVCAGDGAPAYRRGLVEEAARLGLAERVVWVGARNDMPAVYNAFDIAVSSSAYGEGFPNMILEAMATGVPCVVTDVGDSAAIVGSFGWVCPPGDSVALAAAISQAVDALPVDARATREHVSKAYSSANLLERTIGELVPLLGAPRPVTRPSMGGTE